MFLKSNYFWDDFRGMRGYGTLQRTENEFT